jgi:hypothetical protein
MSRVTKRHKFELSRLYMGGGVFFVFLLFTWNDALYECSTQRTVRDLSKAVENRSGAFRSRHGVLLKLRGPDSKPSPACVVQTSFTTTAGPMDARVFYLLVQL